MADAIIKNPTNEEMKPQHNGKLYVFPVGGNAKMIPGSAANHIMNEYGRRGLVVLNYADNTTPSPNKPDMTIEEEKCQAGIERNRKFKMEQVTRFNQSNQKCENEHRPYVNPTPQITQYAKELGLELIQPFVARDNDAAEINTLRDSMKDKDEMLLALKAQNEKLMEMFNELKGEKNQAPQPSKAEMADDEKRQQFARLNKQNFKAWLNQNKSEIGAWPEHIKTEVREKYTRLFEQSLDI